MNLYDRMLNINNKDIETAIKKIINKNKTIITNPEGMCMVSSNLIYNDLLEAHIPCKIINTKELGLGYEHEFIITKDKEVYYLIDITYSQFQNKGTLLNTELLANSYIKIDNNTLVTYLNSIPNTHKIDNINLDNLYLPNIRKK